MGESLAAVEGHRGVRADILVGPTAVGKTEVAHCLARRRGVALCSADSMQVYRGMDLGTAKPTPVERAGLTYAGLDLVTPDQPFSAGAFRSAVMPTLTAWMEAGREILVCGGTGLYVSALLGGLRQAEAPVPEVRARAQALYDRAGLDGLHRALREAGVEPGEVLEDPKNPRRVLRAVERCWGGEGVSAAVPAVGAREPVIGLARTREALYARVERRAQAMFAGGLVAEVEALCARIPVWSATARQAIGYAEAHAVLKGEWTEAEALSRTVVRTRRLIKKQMTWFRHQWQVNWLEVPEDECPETTADRVQELREAHGPALLTSKS